MAFRMIKKKVFPRPHDLKHSFNLSLIDNHKWAVIYPIIRSDEGLGDPATYNSNPEHSSFSEVNSSGCFPDSKVNKIMSTFEFSLTKKCWNTDKVEMLKVMSVPIAFSFRESYTALDEKTQAEVQDMLFMQHETTDRQGYPLYSGYKLNGDSPTLGADEPGLTTSQGIESVDINSDVIYDGLHYYTNKGMLAKAIGPINWHTVTRHRAAKRTLRIDPKSKSINPYTFYGMLIHLPTSGDTKQFGNAGDSSAGDDVAIKCITRYNEWNENYDHQRT